MNEKDVIENAQQWYGINIVNGETFTISHRLLNNKLIIQYHSMHSFINYR